jgi:hypothetical protein
MTRILPRSDKTSTDPDRDEELDGLLVEVLDPTCAKEEEEEELDLISVRRKLAESVGAPVTVCAKIFLHGGELLFERTSPDHPLIIGRHEASDLMIPDNSVSRRHAELTYNDDAWFVRDLDSRSGTQVNGETASGQVRLKEGDRIQCGNAVLNVSFSLPSDSDADAEPSPLLAGTATQGRKSKSSIRGAAAGDTPVLTDGVPDRQSGASTPAVNVARSSSSSASRVALARSPKSGRTDVKKKREMDRQDRREVENIKTFGLLGAAVIALFVIYGIVSSMNTPASPPVPPSVKDQRDRAIGPAQEPAQSPAIATSPATGTERPPESPTDPVAAPDETKTANQEQERPAPVPTDVVEVTPAPPVAPVMERLPDAPEALLDERSPFEPHWFAGPGPGTALTEKGETIKGSFLVEGETLHVDSAGVSTKTKLIDMKELVWDGARDFKEADAAFRRGEYAQAAERYADTLRSIEASLREEGKDPAEYQGRWYAEGRRNECMLKAAQLSYCQAVFEHPDLATAEQLNAAGANYTRVASMSGTQAALRAKFEALLTGGKIVLPAIDQNRWDDLKQQATAHCTPAKSVDQVPGEKVVPQPSNETVALNPPVVPKGAVPALNPQIMTLTCVGGAGDQFIHEVGFLPDGTIYGKGNGFMVGYSKDGAKCLGITGDPNTPGKERRGTNWANKGSSIAVDGVKLTIGYRQVHAILQQPFIESSAGWKWWGWDHEEAKKRELMADSRGVAIYPLPCGKFLAKCWCDGGNTVLEKDPRDLDKKNPALANAYNRCAAGSASLYIVGDAKTGEPLSASWMIHRPQAETADAYGRIYISQLAARKFGAAQKDSLGLGGKSGISIFSPTLSECYFSGTLGGDETYAVAVKDNLLVVGGSIGQSRQEKDGTAKPPETDPAKLPMRNPAQAKPGGGEDGFLAILKLW